MKHRGIDWVINKIGKEKSCEKNVKEKPDANGKGVTFMGAAPPPTLVLRRVRRHPHPVTAAVYSTSPSLSPPLSLSHPLSLSSPYVSHISWKIFFFGLSWKEIKEGGEFSFFFFEFVLK